MFPNHGVQNLSLNTQPEQQTSQLANIFQKKKNILSRIPYRAGKRVNQEIIQTEFEDRHLRKYVNHFKNFEPELPKFSQFIENIYSNDLKVQHQGLVGIRKILSIEHNTPIQKAIDADIISRLIEFLTLDTVPHLQKQHGE